jgi:sec-independent protein translocase protein TatC
MVTEQIPAAPTPQEEEGMSLMEHLVELRNRLVRAGLGVMVGMAVGGFLVLGPPQLLSWMIRSLISRGVQSVETAVQSVGTAENFTTYMAVALAIGVILAMPVIVYQLIAFIVPALLPHEKRYVFIALPFVTGCFLGGVAFGWFITVPAALDFLLHFGDQTLIETKPQLSDLISTVMRFLLINGIVFEMPVIIYVLSALGVVTPQKLGSWRRYAIVIIVIAAAILTPTGDPINLALLAIPMYVLFELGIVLARLAPKRENRAA